MKFLVAQSSPERVKLKSGASAVVNLRLRLLRVAVTRTSVTSLPSTVLNLFSRARGRDKEMGGISKGKRKKRKREKGEEMERLQHSKMIEIRLNYCRQEKKEGGQEGVVKVLLGIT